MSVNVNLLPPELSISKSLSGLLKTLRALGVIAIGAFLVFVVGVGIFFIFSTISLNSLNKNLDTLKSQIAAQKSTEQQIVLLKDRLSKILSIQEIPSSLPNLTVMKPFLLEISSNTSINQLQLDPAKIDLSLGVKTNSDLSAFLNSIKNTDIFKTINLTSFSLNPSTGYSLEIGMVRK